MPLHLTKIAFGTASADSLRRWLEAQEAEAQLTTRYLPKRHAEMAGGSLYWIHQHAIVGRSPLLGFVQRDDGKWTIRLEPRLVAVQPVARRAHQGWRYFAAEDAPADLGAGEVAGDVMPARLLGKLAKLGLA